MTQSTTGLVEKLRATYPDYEGEPCALVNPNGPEAADALSTQETTIAELVAALEKAREALKPSGETKAAYIGEFKFIYTVWDPEGEQEINHHVTVPWTTIKEIMAAIRERALPPTKSRSAL